MLLLGNYDGLSFISKIINVQVEPIVCVYMSMLHMVKCV